MVTMSDLAAAIQSARVLNDLIQANKTLRNFNELVAAVSEVNAKLMAASAVALESQEKQAALAQRIRELEQELMELKNWDREAERYELTEIAPGAVAYSLKPGMEQGEPAHLLCAHCFTRREKAFLQASPPGATMRAYRCVGCGSMLQVIPPSAGSKTLRRV